MLSRAIWMAGLAILSALSAVPVKSQAMLSMSAAARAAYTLYQQRTLTRGTLVEEDGIQRAFDRFAGGGFDVLAGLRPRLLADAEKIAGARVLEGRFTAVQQSMGVAKTHVAAAV
jgi:polar amino acid transport system substrate-binding protein